MPQISVLMATYNAAPFLCLSLDSILQQTYTDFEFIVVNDASTDATTAILSAYDDPRLKIIHNAHNLGLPASLNLGLEAASGAYIARMDSDDIALPERLAAQLDYMERHPQIGVLGTERYILRENNHLYKPATPLRFTHNVITWRVFIGQPFCHPTLMLRQDVLRRVGGYDASFIYGGEDSDLYTRLLGKTRFANLPERWLIYRQHANSMSVKSASKKHHTQRSRHELASQLVGRAYTLQHFYDIATAWYGAGSVPAKRALDTAHFLLELFQALEASDYFDSTDLQDVRGELVQHLFSLRQHSQPQMRLMRHPLRRLLPKRLRHALKDVFGGQPLTAIWPQPRP